MAPTRSEKGKTTPTNSTPIRKKKPGISAAQKQALIDNLQLESELDLIIGRVVPFTDHAR
jgi:hypothetical protein